MLARTAHACELTVQPVVIVQMVQQQALDVYYQRRCKLCASGQKMHDFAKNPRPALRHAAQHDGISPCVGQHIACFLATGDVAVGDHWNGQSGFDLSDRVVFGQTLVALFARAAMHRDHRHTSALRSASNHHCIFMMR